MLIIRNLFDIKLEDQLSEKLRAYFAYFQLLNSVFAPHYKHAYATYNVVALSVDCFVRNFHQYVPKSELLVAILFQIALRNSL